MWSMAIAVSWHAEQTATTGDVTSVVGCASQGALVEQVATVPAQGCAVVHVQAAGSLHVVVTVPIFCVNVTATLFTVYGALTATLHGFAAEHVQGAAGVQFTM